MLLDRPRRWHNQAVSDAEALDWALQAAVAAANLGARPPTGAAVDRLARTGTAAIEARLSWEALADVVPAVAAWAPRTPSWWPSRGRPSRRPGGARPARVDRDRVARVGRRHPGRDARRAGGGRPAQLVDQADQFSRSPI